MAKDKTIKSKHKTGRILLLFSAFIIVFVTIGIITIIRSKTVNARKVTEQLDLGTKFISELDYEQAALAYLNVIEIDPKCEDAYFALIDVYLAMGDFEQAEQILEAAAEELGKYAVKKKREELEELKEEIAKIESGKAIVAEMSTEGFTYEMTEDGLYVCTGFSERGYMQCFKYQRAGSVSMMLPEKSEDGTRIRGIVFSNNIPLSGAYSGNLPVLNIYCPRGYKIYENTNPGEQTYFSVLLRSMEFSEGLERIGDYAFKGCKNLTRVVIPASVQYIGTGAFDDCSEALTIITPLGSYAEKYAREHGINVSTIEDRAIELSLSSFTYDVTEEGFYVCTGLSLAGYQECLGYQNSGVVTITLPTVSESGNVIEGIAFNNNVPIDKVYLGFLPVLDVVCPESYKIYENTNPDAESYYSIMLRSVRFNEGLEYIGDNAFKGCDALMRIVIPASVKHIGKDAFIGCSEDLIIVTPSGSYAESYAKENNIKVQNP